MSKERFTRGLENYDITIEEIESGNWKYAGGDNEAHLRYFRKLYPTKRLPKHTDECVCGHDIQKNCYIQNIKNKEMLILGSCCIKKFLPSKFTRFCERCNESHKNRKDNKCNTCRKINECIVCKVVLDCRHHSYCKKCYWALP